MIIIPIILLAKTTSNSHIGLSNLSDGQLSHDKITRFLNNNLGGLKKLWQYVKKQVRHLEQGKGGVLIIDDTVEENPYTDENEIVC
ncbi:MULTISPECIES: hypothetical protein [unclassified Neochlamydia]|uniref:hypothetical protein n=1 Tax=unclassified Neochlamydia TaxID=2643326 RepID=UPI00140D239E|nr:MULTISPECIES: hypothetical protein [unclassified Neochlamydia]NGY95485.1 hypothetical protein [Neochlamydia sp. AcF84]